MTNPPVLQFRDPCPLQDYYEDAEGNHYSVARLIDDAKDLEPFDCPIAALDLSAVIWRDCDIYELAFHVKTVNDADLEKPIILDWRGRVADGRHRIIKAIVEGRSTIPAVRITWIIEPCREGSG
jgi:hypothetical protein